MFLQIVEVYFEVEKWKELEFSCICEENITKLGKVVWS